MSVADWVYVNARPGDIYSVWPTWNPSWNRIDDIASSLVEGYYFMTEMEKDGWRRIAEASVRPAVKLEIDIPPDCYLGPRRRGRNRLVGVFL